MKYSIAMFSLMSVIIGCSSDNNTTAPELGDNGQDPITQEPNTDGPVVQIQSSFRLNSSEIPKGTPVDVYVVKSENKNVVDTIKTKIGEKVEVEGLEEGDELIVKGQQCVTKHKIDKDQKDLKVNWGKWVEIKKKHKEQKAKWKKFEGYDYEDKNAILVPIDDEVEIEVDGKVVVIDTEKESITEDVLDLEISIKEESAPKRTGRFCDNKLWDHCWDANATYENLIVDKGVGSIDLFDAELQGAYIYDGAFQFETAKSGLYLGEYSFGVTQAEGELEILANFNEGTAANFPQVILGDEGRRMTLYRTETGLSWFKNNDDLVQRLDVDVDITTIEDTKIQLIWGKSGMSIMVNDAKVGSNSITTPFQRSTRDWPDENKMYLGYYDFGTVKVESQFVTPKKLDAEVQYVAVIFNKEDKTNCVDPDLLHCWDYRNLDSETILDKGTKVFNAELNNITVGSIGISFNDNSSNVYLGDSIMGTSKSSGELTLHLNLPSVITKESQVILGDEGRRMSLYRTPEGLIWYKNNDDLYQTLKCENDFGDGINKIKLVWGEQGMAIYVNDVLKASNSITTPYQRSTRDWQDENKQYLGYYEFGTVAVESELSNPQKLEGEFISLSIK